MLVVRDDRTCRGCVWSVLTYADVAATGVGAQGQRGSNAGARSVMLERTRPIAILPLWMLSRVDLTPRWRNDASSHGAWREGVRGPDMSTAHPVNLRDVRS
jgi:hypothetical protein